MFIIYNLIESNKHIINIYFYYNDLKKIKSEWIRDHVIPENNIHKTSYYHMIPAYISLLNYAYYHDSKNQWFCILTESCCPIISPKKFRKLFFNFYNSTIMNWKKAWWNIQFHKRANLYLLPEELHLGNDPWFILKRENVLHCIQFINNYSNFSKTICNGGLANESLFAIIFYINKELNSIIPSVTHIADWNRMSSSTSPHVFKDANKLDISFIESSLKKNNYTVFLRKVSPEFPDEILNYFIYNFDKNYNDEQYDKINYYLIFSNIFNFYVLCVFFIFLYFF